MAGWDIAGPKSDQAPRWHKANFVPLLSCALGSSNSAKGWVPFIMPLWEESWGVIVIRYYNNKFASEISLISIIINIGINLKVLGLSVIDTAAN